MVLEIHVFEIDAVEVHLAQDLGIHHDVVFEFLNLPLNRVKLDCRENKIYLIVFINVTILAQSVRVELAMWAIPGLFVPAVLPVTVVAEVLRRIWEKEENEEKYLCVVLALEVSASPVQLLSG